MLKSRTFGVILAVVSLLGSIAGGILVGHIVFTFMFAFLGLPHDEFSSLIIPGIIVTLCLLTGSATLILAVYLKDKLWQKIVFAINIILSPIIVITDMIIRTIHFFQTILLL